MLFLYYDKDADGSTKTDCDGHKANWFISQTRPSETATEDLDGDGTCNYEVRCTRSLCPFARVPLCPCALVPVCPVSAAVFRVSKTGHPRTFVRRKRPLNGPRERHAFTDTCQTTMNFTTFVCNKQKKAVTLGADVQIPPASASWRVYGSIPPVFISYSRTLIGVPLPLAGGVRQCHWRHPLRYTVCLCADVRTIPT